MNLLRLSTLLVLTLPVLLQGQPKCTNASLNGTLFYTIGGQIKNGSTVVSYDEQGQVTADGAGNLTSGTATTSTAGLIATAVSVSGTYTVNGNCSGTVTLTTGANSLTAVLQVVNGGGLTLSSITSSSLAELGEVRFYRAANATGSQCGNGSISGAYGLLLAGGTYSGGVRTPYEAATQMVFDGNGNITSNTGEVTTDSTNGPQSFNGTGTYSIASNCSGTAQLTLPNTTQVNYLIARVEGGTVLFLETDSSTTVSGAANPQLLQQVLPQFVFGAGTWYSAIYFSNPTSATVSFSVTFLTDTGTPLAVPGVPASGVKTVTLAPGSTTVIEAPSTGANVLEGYASFALPAGVTGYGVYRRSQAGQPNQEVLVGFRSATQTATSLIFDETNGLVTGLAVLNSSGVATTVNIAVFDNAGNSIGTTTLALPSGNKMTVPFLDQLPNLSGMVGKRGYALFSVATGNVSVLALRSSGVAFTSVPTVQVQ
jgi:hypothetical protein